MAVKSSNAARAPRVLIVDDSAVDRGRLCAMLSRRDYAVCEAVGVTDAILQCELELPDVVISDWVMPVESGLDLCQILREQFDASPLFIIATSRNATADVIAAMDAGADDFITKPIQIEELRARIDAGLRRIYRAIDLKPVFGKYRFTAMSDKL